MNLLCFYYKNSHLLFSNIVTKLPFKSYIQHKKRLLLLLFVHILHFNSLAHKVTKKHC